MKKSSLESAPGQPAWSGFSEKFSCAVYNPFGDFTFTKGSPMLEQPSLLLRPWVHSLEVVWPKNKVQGAGWLRIIADPATDRPLGFAAWETAGLSAWLAWLGRKKIQVFESEDESLLMTLYRPWGLMRMWEVLDAEERRVGRLFRDAIFDGYGSRLATMSVTADGSEMVLRATTGTVLGTWQDIPGQGCFFRFGEALDGNPFVRMVTLAGVLALPPWPGDLVLAARPAV
jgi:hypothetical protein